jgi:predicted dehydrogenase
MLAKAESAGVRHMIHFTHRWEPHNRFMLELAGDGYVGLPYHARFSFMGDYARGPGYHWRWDRRYALGALGDLGSHMIDLARLAFGEIARVHAHLLSHVDRLDPDGKPYDAANDSALLTILFRNGAQGTIQVGAVAQVWDQHVSLCGEAGALDLDFDYDNPFAVRGARRGAEAYQTLPIPEHLLGGIEESCTGFDRIGRIFTEHPVGARLFIDSVVEDRPISPSFADGVKAQAVIEAAFESDRTGCWVDVE